MCVESGYKKKEDRALQVMQRNIGMKYESLWNKETSQNQMRLVGDMQRW